MAYFLNTDTNLIYWINKIKFLDWLNRTTCEVEAYVFI